MTKIADLKKRFMNDPAFLKEYEKADAEFSLIETAVKARATPTADQNRGPQLGTSGDLCSETEAR